VKLALQFAGALAVVLRPRLLDFDVQPPRAALGYERAVFVIGTR